MISRFLLTFFILGGIAFADESRVTMKTDAEKGVTTIAIDGKTTIEYRHGDDVDLPHFFPWNSVSGRNMTIDITDPYPHHRAFWVAETKVTLDDGEKKTDLSNYMALGSGKKTPDSKWPVGPFRNRSKHIAFSNVKSTKDTLEFDETILWLAGETKIADELRHYRFKVLNDGEYFLDFSFKIVAAYGKLTVKADVTHYAWPYVRMNDTFNVEKGGGTITNSEGAVGQGATDQKEALWVDYSAPTPDGGAEGLACFIHPSQNPPHRWLTRSYGTWGPRRKLEHHNTTFDIPKGESLGQRVGLLIHRGDVKTGSVAERYQAYCDGKL